MRKSYFAMLAVAAGVALTGLAAAPASAMPAAKHGAAAHGTVQKNVIQVRQGGRHGIHRGGHHYRHFRGPRFYVAPVYSYRSSGNGCYWLKRKAINTGSRYWMRRYQECRWG